MNDDKVLENSRGADMRRFTWRPKLWTTEPEFRSRTFSVAATPRRSGVIVTSPPHVTNLKTFTRYTGDEGVTNTFCDEASQPPITYFGVRDEWFQYDFQKNARFFIAWPTWKTFRQNSPGWGNDIGYVKL